MTSDDLPGGVYTEVDGHVHPARHVTGRATITLIDGVHRVIDRAAADRLYLRTVRALWQDEPVTIWAARTPGTVRVQYEGKDWNRAQALGMRGDRTMWELDVAPSEVTITEISEVDLD